MGRHPWSKLQRAVYINIAPNIDFQLHCRVYRMRRTSESLGPIDVPRYWVSLGKEIIWDYPRHFDDRSGFMWVYVNKVSQISNVIREYLLTPRKDLLSAEFPDDLWGIVNILRAADVRIGRQRWDLLEQTAQNEAVTKILAARRTKTDRLSPETERTYKPST